MTTSSTPPCHSSSRPPSFVITVGIDTSFPLPPSPLANDQQALLDSRAFQQSPFSHPPAPRNSGILPQIGIVYESSDRSAAEYSSASSSSSLDRLPSPMFHKDSPSSSNRSSTSSSNSSGYLGSSSSSSGGHVSHRLALGGRQKNHRLSAGHSSESGLSSSAASRHSHHGVSSSSQSSLDTPDETGLRSASVHVNQLLQRGLKETEVLSTWLKDLQLTECYPLFVQAGYDMPTISRMTPEDLTAVGITQPAIRKRLTSEISKLHISDGLPNHKPNSLQEWLQCIGLVEYYNVLARDGYEDLDRVLDIIWEDLEDIGIRKLGHQKKVMLAIDRLKKLKTSMQRLSSTDQYSSTNCSNQSKPLSTTTTSCILSRPPPAHDNHHPPLRRSHSGENLASPPREMTPSHPQPELVTIQVNVASRSWPGKRGVARDTDECPNALTYESFYGNPLQDFHCLRKEADEDEEEEEEGRRNTASSSEGGGLDRARDDDRAAAFVGVVRFRPRPSSQPRVQLNCRTRRASGGSSLAESGSGVDRAFPAAVRNSPELSRRFSSAGLSSSHSVPNTPAHGKAASSSGKSTQPPPTPPLPPVRTRSVTTGAGSTYDLSVRFDSSAHDARNAAIVSQTDGVSMATASSSQMTQQLRVTPFLGSSSSSRENFQPNGSIGPNSLPFSNEDFGTIRQKPTVGNFLHRTKVLGERDSLEALNRDDHRQFAYCSSSAVAKGKTPFRPNPEQKQKFAGNKGTKCHETGAGASGPAATSPSDDVFNDIDDLFQGLSQELDQLLTFQG